MTVDNYFSGMKETLQPVVKVFTIDRSDERYGNSTMEQAKGRDRAAKLSLIVSMAFAALFLTLLILGATYGSLASYIFAGIMGTGALVAAKEALVQKYARDKELESNPTTGEYAIARYTLGDFMDELQAKMQHAWNSCLGK